MAGEWMIVTVGDLVSEGVLDRPLDGNHGSIHPKTSDYVADGIPFIGAGNLVDGRVDLQHCNFISLELAKTLRKGFAKSGDVLLTNKAVLGRVALVGKLSTPFIVLTPQVTYYRSLDPTRLLTRFLRFYFESPEFQNALHSWSGTTSTIASVSITNQLQLPIRLPPLPEQKRIAHVLGTLDDKIDLNRRMNATLEGISRALFKSWFVDFDPVRQKAAGKQPVGMDAQTAAIFPDSFEDSEMGEVPKGWRAGVVGEYADLNPESWSKATYPDEVRYVDLSSTKWGEVEAIESYGRESAPSRAQRILRPGDTIFGTVRPGNGSFAIVDEDGLTGSTGFAVLRPKPRECREYVYLATTTSYNVDRLAHLADGGAYPAVRPEVVADTPLVSAPPAVVMMFSERTSGCFDRIAENRRESRTLAALRNTLLPKLLSGEIRVPEAEQAVEEAIA